MALQLKVLTTSVTNLSSVPRTHMREKKIYSVKLFCDLYMCALVHLPPVLMYVYHTQILFSIYVFLHLGISF